MTKVMMTKTEILLIADPRVLAVEVRDCGEALVDLKITGGMAYGPPPEVPESAPYYTQMRQGVFDRLMRAQKDLPCGWRFKLYEGWRSWDLQKFLFDNRYNRLRQDNPDKTHEEIFVMTTRIVSPVINLDGTENIPPHATGAAVDIYLIDANGDEVDMGMSLYEWADSEAKGLNYTYADNLSPEARANRHIMIDVMSKHEFVNYPTEWWHWSYGDRYWAYHKQKPFAIYGVVK